MAESWTISNKIHLKYVCCHNQVCHVIRMEFAYNLHEILVLN